MKIITEEQKEKISQTKTEISKKEILEGIVKNNIPEQSTLKLAVPTNRTRKQISFDEFREFIRQGKNINGLIKDGVSKHLLAFYSVLSKGKITLSKEQFEQEYQQGISLDEIARSHNISRELITQLREYYGIKRKGATFIKRLQNEVPLSQEAKDIIIGSLLGDGHITPLGYFSEKHSEKQVEYLEWKAEFLKPILTSKSFSAYPYFDKRYGHNNYSFCLRTIAHSFLYEMRDKFYKEVGGKVIKVLPDNIEELMNERVLAVWFMDDGHTDWMYRNGVKEYNFLPQCKFSSESFSFEENVRIQKMLQTKFSIISNIKFRTREETKAFVKIPSVSSSDLIKLIKPFATRDLLYKFDEQEYLAHKERVYNPETIMESFLKKHNAELQTTSEI